MSSSNKRLTVFFGFHGAIQYSEDLREIEKRVIAFAHEEHPELVPQLARFELLCTHEAKCSWEATGNCNCSPDIFVQPEHVGKSFFADEQPLKPIRYSLRASIPARSASAGHYLLDPLPDESEEEDEVALTASEINSILKSPKARGRVMPDLVTSGVF